MCICLGGVTCRTSCCFVVIFRIPLSTADFPLERRFFLFLLACVNIYLAFFISLKSVGFSRSYDFFCNYHFFKHRRSCNFISLGNRSFNFYHVVFLFCSTAKSIINTFRIRFVRVLILCLFRHPWPNLGGELWQLSA